MKTILIVGATGAQGGAVAQYLSTTNEYNTVALTRSATSAHAEALAALPNVKLAVSSVGSGYDTTAFLAAASEADFVLVNTDGFALGEQAETFWGIRLFELAARAGVKHLIYSEWMHAQKDSKMAWTIIRSGPYLQMLSLVMTPTKEEDGSATFNLPLADGAIPFIDLDDFGKYVHWALSHPSQSTGLDFGIATAHVSGNELAETFAAHSQKAAKYNDIPAQYWNAEAWQYLPKGPETKIGFQSTKDDSTLTMTYGENFTNWWNLYKASADNKGLITRDYEFLDKIVPDRTKGLKEWMGKFRLELKEEI
ncbi:NAD(P)-binding protein [Microthyrium microscopicum]|uniref:NAD(P)-binding protein n=1 Tax=Microthyrium microscopicum TaxID=703497 RepID=A0A6A6UJE4_9PEZI|nr:NAD(P)-binding protein [Microthyrium microscopicum]